MCCFAVTNVKAVAGFFFTSRWRFNRDIKLMLGFEPSWYFKITWSLVTPLALVVSQCLLPFLQCTIVK